MLTLASILMSSVFIIGSAAIGNPDTLNDDLRNRIAITEVVDSMGTLADLGQYDRLQKLFTDEVTVDYTSLFPGEVQNISSQQLMAQW